MKLQQQYEAISELKVQIGEKLKNLDFLKIKEFLLWLAKSEKYQDVKRKDRQLVMLDAFCRIWLQKKKELDSMGIREDIFYGVDSFETMERKYLMMQFGVLRLETVMPEEYYVQVADFGIQYKVSGIAWYYMIEQQTAEREKNILKLAELLEEKGQIVTVLQLLRKGSERFPDNRDMWLRLADCWLAGQQWEQALSCLKNVKEPDDTIKELIKQLEVASNETI